VITALTALNITATPEIWDAPGTDWSAFDLVVIRATWDYAEQREAFLDWARDVPRLANPYGVIEWNTDKIYLADLAAAGVATIPTSWYRPGSAVELPPSEIVVKPSVGAGARNAGHYGPTDRAAARDHVTRLLAEGRTVMVQPYLAQLEDSGERGLVYLGDRYSHAIAKPAILATRGPKSRAHSTGMAPSPPRRRPTRNGPSPSRCSPPCRVGGITCSTPGSTSSRTGAGTRSSSSSKQPSRGCTWTVPPAPRRRSPRWWQRVSTEPDRARGYQRVIGPALGAAGASV
jgi:hypothetical protein